MMPITLKVQHRVSINLLRKANIDVIRALKWGIRRLCCSAASRKSKAIFDREYGYGYLNIQQLALSLS